MTAVVRVCSRWSGSPSEWSCVALEKRPGVCEGCNGDGTRTDETNRWDELCGPIEVER